MFRNQLTDMRWKINVKHYIKRQYLLPTVGLLARRDFTDAGGLGVYEYCSTNELCIFKKILISYVS